MLWATTWYVRGVAHRRRFGARNIPNPASWVGCAQCPIVYVFQSIGPRLSSPARRRARRRACCWPATAAGSALVRHARSIVHLDVHGQGHCQADADAQQRATTRAGQQKEQQNEPSSCYIDERHIHRLPTKGGHGRRGPRLAMQTKASLHLLYKAGAAAWCWCALFGPLLRRCRGMQ
jgi:hypothetical protein